MSTLLGRMEIWELHMIGVNNWMDNGRFIILLKGNIRKGIYVKEYT
jgi:hypothetical protein